MKEEYRRPVYIDEIKEECLKEGVLEGYLREIEAGEHPQRKCEWCKYALSALVIVDWGVVCAIALWGKVFTLVPALVCGWIGVVFFVMYIFSHE